MFAGPRDYHTQLSKPDRKRQILCDTTHVWNLKKTKDTNELIYKTVVDSCSYPPVFGLIIATSH